VRLLANPAYVKDMRPRPLVGGGNSEEPA
jgi:hypothetical protein